MVVAGWVIGEIYFMLKIQQIFEILNNLVLIVIDFSFDLIPKTFEDVDILLRLLNHLHPLLPHLQHGGVGTQSGLVVIMIFPCQLVHRDESSSPTHACAAVNQDRVCASKQLWKEIC